MGKMEHYEWCLLQRLINRKDHYHKRKLETIQCHMGINQQADGFPHALNMDFPMEKIQDSVQGGSILFMSSVMRDVDRQESECRYKHLHKKHMPGAVVVHYLLLPTVMSKYNSINFRMVTW